MVVVVPVGCFRRFLQLVVGAIEQVLGTLRMSAEIKFIGLLRGHNPFVGLLAKPLRRSQVGMAAPNIAPWRTLCNCRAGSQRSGTHNTSRDKITSVHKWGNLCRPR